MIKINENKCIGCGKCTEICPGNLLILKNKKAAIRDIRDCWGCTACVKVCPKNAICYQLSADLGGAGAKLFANDEKNTLKWIVEFPNGAEKIIEINKKQSNRY